MLAASSVGSSVIMISIAPKLNLNKVGLPIGALIGVGVIGVIVVVGVNDPPVPALFYRKRSTSLRCSIKYILSLPL